MFRFVCFFQTFLMFFSLKLKVWLAGFDIDVPTPSTINVGGFFCFLGEKKCRREKLSTKKKDKSATQFKFQQCLQFMNQTKIVLNNNKLKVFGNQNKRF